MIIPNILRPILALPCFIGILFFGKMNGQEVLHVGPGFQFSSIQEATMTVSPGDTILVHGDTYPGGMFIANLQGLPDAWIHIHAAPGETAILEGGNNSIQLSDPAYLEIRGLIITGQTGNGMNIDDGGTYDTPAHHVRILECTFRDIAANGNNDLLKLSGLDSFLIQNCQFLNGAEGGSGADMVGCHYGVFEDNIFENMGSNSIQAKGGTQYIRIQRNVFRNGGLRNINLGGSTGLAFFRPDTAHFEAADLQVYSNIFIGGWAGLAYVGSVRVDVANNTFYYPENWVFRILQETVDTSRFISCGENIFRNNIVYYGDVHRDVNIGPNTRPETFLIDHNLWFKPDEPGFTGPNLPVIDSFSLVQEDPLFMNASNGTFQLLSGSPAIGAGRKVPGLTYDHDGNLFNDPPSIGAFEADPAVSIYDQPTNGSWENISVFPNPASGSITLRFDLKKARRLNIDLLSLDGHKVQSLFSGKKHLGSQHLSFPISVKKGVYLIRLYDGVWTHSLPLIIF